MVFRTFFFSNVFTAYFLVFREKAEYNDHTDDKYTVGDRVAVCSATHEPTAYISRYA